MSSIPGGNAGDPMCGSASISNANDGTISIGSNSIVIDPGAAGQFNTTGTITSTSGSGAYYPGNVTYTSSGTSWPPFTISNASGEELLRLDQDGKLRVSKIQSEKGAESGEHSHVIQGFFHIEGTRIIAGFRCTECDEVLTTKTIFKVPKTLKKAKCLPRILKKV